MADLIARLKLDDKGLDAQLKGVSSKFKTAATGIAAIAIPVAAIAGIARMVEGLAAIGERAIEAAGSLHDTSAQLGVTAERLQELRLIAKNAGVDVQGFDKSLGILNRTLGQASLGQGQFEKIATTAGIALRNEQGQIKSTSEVWDMLTAKIQSGALSQNQAIALAASAFGREGGKMVAVLRQTAEEQQKVIDTARQFGAIISNEVVRSADEYGDKLDLIKAGTEALGIQNAIVLAPLTLAWAQLKNEIAMTLAEFLHAQGIIKDTGASVEMLRNESNKNLEQILKMQARLDAGASGHERVNSEKAIITLRERNLAILNELIDRQKQSSEIQQGRESAGQEAEDAAEAEAAAKENARIAKASADYELQLVTEVYAERERLRALEMEQEFGWATTMAEERERIYAEELQQEMDWATVLAEERDRAANMELTRFIEKEGLLTEARRQGNEDRLKWDKMTTGQQISTVVDGLAKQTAGLAQHNKKMFNLNKAAAISQAVISTAQGIAKGVALGWPLGIPAVAWAVATGAAQISAIKNTQFGGGGTGTTPSAVGSTSVVNDQPVGSGSGQGASRTIAVQGIDPGKMFSGRQMRDLAEQMAEFLRDGGKLVFV